MRTKGKACPNCGWEPPSAAEVAAAKRREWVEEYTALREQGCTDRLIADALGYDTTTETGLRSFYERLRRAHKDGLL